MRRFTACLLALILLASVSCCAAAEKDILLTEFNCKDLDGKDVDITLLDGADLLLVDIWEPWCGWCLKEAEMAQVARWIAKVLREGEAAVPAVRSEVEALMANYPLYT